MKGIVGGELTFLIVEDERLVGLALSRMFASFGRVEVVTTLDAARKVLDDRRFDALIVDIKLPDGSGFDVVAYARERSPDTEALVLSGSVDAGRLSTAFTLGVTYLVKPASHTQLQDFAKRTRARRLKHSGWLRGVIAMWVARYGLTPAEEAVLALAIDGRPRLEIAERRDVSPSTLKKQVQSLLAKTGDATLESAANRALRAALEAKP
ncbi:MAG: response regulator transcription factor [Labilithrix sp.]|nr:response regulator transcription factor [Labilithrix sp.]MCW5832005.1 response regulator transcription factor [Labilithrix sp.]